jgi:ABC-type branched-subunit amino acid transport system substrate-binding protein
MPVYKKPDFSSERFKLAPNAKVESVNKKGVTFILFIIGTRKMVKFV